MGASPHNNSLFSLGTGCFNLTGDNCWNPYPDSWTIAAHGTAVIISLRRFTVSSKQCTCSEHKHLFGEKESEWVGRENPTLIDNVQLAIFAIRSHFKAPWLLDPQALFSSPKPTNRPTRDVSIWLVTTAEIHILTVERLQHMVRQSSFHWGDLQFHPSNAPVRNTNTFLEKKSPSGWAVRIQLWLTIYICIYDLITYC